MELIVRADDLGYSKAVSLGILESVQNGIINNVGLMVNMRDSAHGVALLQGEDVCLGMHTNISAGCPVSPADMIPSLTDGEGRFRSSRSYQTAEEDISLEEAILEVEAQYQRFKALTGKRPGYIDGHAVSSGNFFKAMELVADRHHVLYSSYPAGPDFTRPVTIGSRTVYLRGGSTLQRTPKECLEEVLGDTGHVSLVVYHPGYVDATIMRESSLNLPRVYELEYLTDPDTRRYLTERNIHLLRFDKLEEK